MNPLAKKQEEKITTENPEDTEMPEKQPFSLRARWTLWFYE